MKLLFCGWFQICYLIFHHRSIIGKRGGELYEKKKQTSFEVILLFQIW
jgi:hypothetical protein